jgi:hypothetical protein
VSPPAEHAGTVRRHDLSRADGEATPGAALDDLAPKPVDIRLPREND